ncbi:MAG TPA: hypothetical protein VKU92_01315 [Acidimicrobiales bacterium]|nr:hypothetical protein [Acidimicrobiales bacterium]
MERAVDAERGIEPEPSAPGTTGPGYLVGRGRGWLALIQPAGSGAVGHREPRPLVARWRRAFGPLVVVLTVVCANAPVLLGIVRPSPIGATDSASLHLVHGYLPGISYLDPSVGWIFAPLAHLSAMDWIHGVVPWWNPYEGLGAPLAAGMQSASLFPPVLLLLLPNGIVWFHVALELAAGLATWLLVRELGFGRGVATAGGVLWALNGTFAWFAHAPSDPLPFLPLMLLGVERLWRRQRVDLGGWLAIAFGLALSVYGGFPETAYFSGLLVAVWFGFRLLRRPRRHRLSYLAAAATAGVTGLLLAAPLLVPVAEYLPYADIGRHAGQIGVQPFVGSAIQMIGIPYLYGSIAAFNWADRSHALTYFWGSASGGYLTSSVILLALIGAIAGRSQVGLRRLLGVFGLLALAWQLAVPPFAPFFQAVVPFASTANAFRYLSPAWEMAAVLLACAGLDAIAHGSPRLRWAAISGGLVTLAWIGVEVRLAWPTIETIYRRSPAYRPYPVGTIAWAVGMVVVLVVVVLVAAAGKRSRSKRARIGAVAAGAATLLAGVLVVTDAAAMFVLPELSAPRQAPIDQGPVSYLRRHLGNERFFSMWAYHAEAGSYFELASLNSNTMPVPEQWARYVDRYLSHGADALTFDGTRVPPGAPSAKQELRRNLSRYEAAGVRYVLTLRSNKVFGRALRGDRYLGGVRRVYEDRRFVLYALPRARPFFSTASWPRAPPCRLQVRGISAVVARCEHPATLVRNELDLPGWTATVNGAPSRLLRLDGGVTGIRLPAGTSVVVFSYLPPGFAPAMALFALGCLAVVGMLLRRQVSRLAAATRRRFS